MMMNNKANGYRDSIDKGLMAMKYFNSGIYGGGDRAEEVAKLKQVIEESDAIVLGAGAGLSTAAGLTYSGERFEKYFFDFSRAYGIKDMYSGGFYPFPSKEMFWAWWSRHIYFNRYINPPLPVYNKLFNLIKNKDYFVITTNVDHQFQRAGFDKKRLFYTQGDYGLFQAKNPIVKVTFDNQEIVEQMLLAQGFVRDGDGILQVPEDKNIKMAISTDLIPTGPNGEELTMNLRSDDTFVEDEGWHKASSCYSDFLNRHEGMKVLFLEVGVGMNTPVIIKYPFWQMTLENPNSTYACLNFNEAFAPNELKARSIVIDGDVNEYLDDL